MIFLDNVAEFARPLGSKDKTPRKKRLLQGAAVVGGIGALALGGRKLRNVLKNKSVKPIENTIKNENLITKPQSLIGLSKVEKSARVKKRRELIQNKVDPKVKYKYYDDFDDDLKNLGRRKHYDYSYPNQYAAKKWRKGERDLLYLKEKKILAKNASKSLVKKMGSNYNSYNYLINF